MFKNFIIIFLFFLLSSLLIQKPDNAELLIKDLATSKEMVFEGTEYIKNTFNKEFSVIEEKKETIKEKIKEKVDLSKRKPLVNPFHKGEFLRTGPRFSLKRKTSRPWGYFGASFRGHLGEILHTYIKS